ncbi:hypothetical protein BV25DRAFT_772272 [Artomyces pyxidatus]|uniref:Uncharacterized protein n=1 Tax=Artomyces pyxidatus TaxID=48021 RepID=A0ACB8SYR6_9AGAM|nr:hypothetical protein BV25DRAFT_772272 [Artomyces pyxidatus]
MSALETTLTAIPRLVNPRDDIIMPPVKKMSVEEYGKWVKNGTGVCKGCYKHLRSSHDDSSSCGGCLPADVVALRKCSRCRNMFYCSTVCQKAGWGEHRAHCSPFTADDEKTRKEIFNARCDAMNSFCYNSGLSAQVAPMLADIADAAIGIQSEERHVLLAYVDVESPNANKVVPLSPRTLQFRYIVRSAGIVPISRIEQILKEMRAKQAAKGRVHLGMDSVILNELVPRPSGWIPALVIDEGIPYPCNSTPLHLRYNGDLKPSPGTTLWNIQKLVYGGEAVDPRRDPKVDPNVTVSRRLKAVKT